MQKILIILAAVLSLGATTLGYLNREKLLRERDAKTAALTERDVAKKAETTSAAELKSTKEKLALTTADSEKTAAEVVDLRARIEKSDSLLTDVQKQVADKDAALALQKTDMEAKDTRIAELETKTSKSDQSSDSGASAELKKQLEEKDILTTSLQTKLKDQESQLTELVKREDQRRKKTMRTGLEGRILAVNQAWNFVVLSLGDRNGVIGNAEMLIKRGSQLIGKVRITSVEPSTSIADIIANSVRSGLTVQPGDTVIYYGPEDGSDPLKQ
jgi:chromosome segregation ATPase